MDKSDLFSFHHSHLNRCGEKRSDELYSLSLNHLNPRFYLFHKEQLILKVLDKGYDPTFSRPELKDFEIDWDLSPFLGIDEEHIPYFSLFVRENRYQKEYIEDNLRNLAIKGGVDFEEQSALAQGRSLCHWHYQNQYCGICGSKSKMALAGYQRVCTSCDQFRFPRTDPVVIMLAVHEDHCLLGRQKTFASNIFSCLAGFMEPGETIENAMARELYEEAGIRVNQIRYFSSQPWPFPSSIMIGGIAQSLSTKLIIDHNELEECRWFNRDEILQMQNKTHPDGLNLPTRISIAHRLIAHWVLNPSLTF